MNRLTPSQLKTIATLCSVLKINADDKEAMVAGFSNGREVSSKHLYFEEAKTMIAHLNPHPLKGGNKPGDKMIGKMLSLCREMHWTKTNTAGKIVADYNRLDEWATKYGYLKKKIKHYKYPELPKLVSQFEAVYKHLL